MKNYCPPNFCFGPNPVDLILLGVMTAIVILAVVYYWSVKAEEKSNV